MANFVTASSLTSQSVASTTWTDYETLAFTPDATGEHWVVVVTWRRAADGGGHTPRQDSRVLLNGSVKLPSSGGDPYGVKAHHSSTRWTSYTSFFKITGTTSLQTVTLQCKAHGTTDNEDVDHIYMVAFQIPDALNADIQYTETLAETQDSSNPTNVINTTFTPSSSGQYVLMAQCAHKEGPSSAGNGVKVIDETGTKVQKSKETFMTLSDGLNKQMFHVELRPTLSATSQNFKIDHTPGTGSGSERSGAVLLLFRADAFDNAEHAASEGLSSTTSSTYQQKNTLSPAAGTKDRVYVTVVDGYQTEKWHATGEFTQVTLDGTQQIEGNWQGNRPNYQRTDGWAWAENAAAQDINQDFRTGDATEKTMNAKYAHIVVLTYAAGGGGVTVTPNFSSLRMNTINPTVLANVVVTPSPVTSTFSSVVPTVDLGSVVVSPGATALTLASVAPVVQIGSGVVIPSSSHVSLSTTMGNVVLGDVLITPASRTFTLGGAGPIIEGQPEASVTTFISSSRTTNFLADTPDSSFLVSQSTTTFQADGQSTIFASTKHTTTFTSEG